MADKAREWTDEKLEEMEKRLTAIYSRADAEISKKYRNLIQKLSIEDKKKREQLEGGKITEGKYKNWLKKKLLIEKQARERANEIAAELARVNEMAIAYINGEIPEIYGINYNQLSESVGYIEGYTFTLVDANTVKRLSLEDETLLPFKELDEKKDVRWNTKKINAELLQGILQGESVDEIAKRLSTVTEMNRSSAVKNARTIVTSAECKGRQDSYVRAKKDGIILRKFWIPTHDKRIRDWHRQAGMDYPEENAIDIDDFFYVDGQKMLHPGDNMHGASGHNLYNCRCSVASKVIGFKKEVV